LVFPPPDLPANVNRRSDGYLYATIRNGGLIMPSQGSRVAPALRWDIVNYLRSVAPPPEKKPPEPTPVPKPTERAKTNTPKPQTQPQETNAPPGDAAAGKQIFDAKCRICHESDSEQAKIGPGLKGVFHWPPHTMSDGTEHREHTEAMIRKQIVAGGGKMPPIGAKFSDQEISDLIAYLRTL